MVWYIFFAFSTTLCFHLQFLEDQEKKYCVQIIFFQSEKNVSQSHTKNFLRVFRVNWNTHPVHMWGNDSKDNEKLSFFIFIVYSIDYY